MVSTDCKGVRVVRKWSIPSLYATHFGKSFFAAFRFSPVPTTAKLAKAVQNASQAWSPERAFR